MKKSSITFVLMAALALTMPVLAHAGSGSSRTVEGFDFNYTAETHSGFSLVQVFDDGDMTYFQFADHSEFPTVDIIHENGRHERVQLEAKTPYLIVRGVANKFALQKNKKTILVRYNGKRVLDAPPVIAKTEPKEDKPKVVAIAAKKDLKPSAVPAEPEKFDDMRVQVPTPAKKQGELVTAIKINVPFFDDKLTVSKKSREDIEERVRQLRYTHRAVIHPRPSIDNDMVVARTRGYALESILRGAGMSVEDIESVPQEEAIKGKNPNFYISEIIMIEGKNSKQPAATADAKLAPPPLPILTVKAGESLSEHLAVWAKRYGHTLVWEAGDYRPGTDITIQKGFMDTLNAIVAAMKINGVILEPTVYGNKVVRIVEKKQ